MRNCLFASLLTSSIGATIDAVPVRDTSAWQYGLTEYPLRIENKWQAISWPRTRSTRSHRARYSPIRDVCARFPSCSVQYGSSSLSSDCVLGEFIIISLIFIKYIMSNCCPFRFVIFVIFHLSHMLHSTRVQCVTLVLHTHTIWEIPNRWIVVLRRRCCA